MKVEIVSDNDDKFKIRTKDFGAVVAATDGERVALGATEELAISAVEEMQELTKKSKQATPIENNKGLDWFGGTSWGK